MSVGSTASRKKGSAVRRDSGARADCVRDTTRNADVAVANKHEEISAADALFATALRSDEPDGFGDFSDEFLENFGV